MPILRRGPARLHYEVTGSGFPVLALAPGGMRSRMERWRGNASFRDPASWLATSYRVVTLDQRNAGQSTAPVSAVDDWQTYADDHLALMDHLEIDRFHILGACIGVSFALRLCNQVQNRVVSAVLQNPIGLVPGNRPVVDKMFSDWESDLAGRDDIDRAMLPGFQNRLFGGDFIFSVTREAVACCTVPLMLLPGSDDIHPAAISAEIAALAPDITVVDPWKSPALVAQTAAEVESFLARYSQA